MTATTAEAIPHSQPTMPLSMLDILTDDDATEIQALVQIPVETAPVESDRQQIAEAVAAATTDNALGEEIKLGFEQLRAMNHTELRQVIARRVELLETVLRDRKDRREVIDTARLASRMLDLRRERALRIRKRVNFGSALAAVASTMLIVAVMV